MDFLTLAKKRCTTRGFMEKEILSKDLEQILSAGRVAPTACNRQPQRIIVVRRRENMVKVERSEEHTSELQSRIRISYAVFCLKKKK